MSRQRAEPQAGAELLLQQGQTSALPFIVTEDAIYVLRDGSIWRYDLVGEVDESFTPISV